MITGAGRGLGAAVAELFAAEGATVVAADVDLPKAEGTAARIVAGGGEALALATDITTARDAEMLMDITAQRFGGLDVLVNNAGIASQGTVCDVGEEQWDRVMGVNLKGAYLCSRFAVPHMERGGGGSIVCIASASAVIGQMGQVAYNVSKHAVVGLVRCMALDHAEAKIRVNAVCPGTIETPMVGKMFRDSGNTTAARENSIAKHPMGRLGIAEEVASVIVFLCSSEASFVTGQSISVDGGRSIR